MNERAPMTREEALRKHREMWRAMQKELGDNPSFAERTDFKFNWCYEHDGGDVFASCYLCQFAEDHDLHCCDCLIDWEGQHGCIGPKVHYGRSPISEILALPRRKVTE